MLHSSITSSLISVSQPASSSLQGVEEEQDKDGNITHNNTEFTTNQPSENPPPQHSNYFLTHLGHQQKANRNNDKSLTFED